MDGVFGRIGRVFTLDLGVRFLALVLKYRNRNDDMISDLLIGFPEPKRGDVEEDNLSVTRSWLAARKPQTDTLS